MYNNYIFDLYGTLIDINTDEWNDDLWKKIAILYAYKGAHYTYDELNEEYDRLVQAEKKAVLKKSPDTKVVDIKIEKVFRKLFTQKGVKVTKAEVFFIAEAFRCYSTKYIKLYDGVLDLLDTLKAKGKKIYLLSNAQRSFTENELNMFDLTKYFDGICIPQLPPAAEKARVEELRRAAKADLPDRIGRLSRITGLKYNKLTIRASRTKWGSCTGTNNISLSLFLMTLPEHLRDFVIVHELCHTVHHDHSPKFHALVDRLVGGNEKALNRELKAFSIRG